MTARPAVDPTAYLRRDGSNTITGNITPDTTATRELGSQALQFSDFSSTRAIVGAFSGNGVVSFDNTYTTMNGFVGVGGLVGPGTSRVLVGGGYYSPVATFANTYTPAVGTTAEVLNGGGGSFVTGSAFVGTSATSGAIARLQMSYTSYGSFLGGYTFQSASTGTSLIYNGGSGSFVWGYVSNNLAGTSTVQSTYAAPGSFVVGRCEGSGHTLQTSGQGAFAAGLIQGSGHTIQATNQGTFAQGRCGGGTAGGVIEATNQGAFAQGRTNNLATITASGRGALAQGNAQNAGAYILASGNGALAHGQVANSGSSIQATGVGAVALGRTTSGYDITATSNGAFAMGDAAGANITASATGAFAFGSATTAAIVASATNSVQIGPGTNNTADSLQIGTGVQFGTATGNVRFDGRIDSNTTLVTTTTHTAANEFVILCDDDTAGGAITVTLPLAATAKTMYNVKKLGTTGNVIVDGNGAETVDGAANTTITAQYSSRTLVSDGTSWHILTSQGA